MCNCIYSYTGASLRYGYSARSFALSDAMVADEYHIFQSFSNPSSLNQCNGTNYVEQILRLIVENMSMKIDVDKILFYLGITRT